MTRHMLLAAGTCLSVAGLVSAQPFVVNITGATLQESFFLSPQSTIDFLDVDGDTITTPATDQLAPSTIGSPGSFNPDAFFVVQYRAVGSGNGFAELVAHSLSSEAAVLPPVRDGGLVDLNGGDPGNGVPALFQATQFDESIVSNGDLSPTAPEIAVVNRTSIRDVNSFGAPLGDVTIQFFPVSSLDAPGNMAFVHDRTANPLTFTAIAPDGGTVQGWNADIAPIDVPARWFVTQSGSFAPRALPGATGYGNNGLFATEKDGTLTGRNNKLKSIGNKNLADTQNPGNNDAFSLFDTPISFTPIAILINPGADLEQATFTDLRHAFGTGRRLNGENLMVITRDSGSGTRNGCMNTLGLDPSAGVGDNIGNKTSNSVNDIPGPNYQPSNKGGSSRMDSTVINTRLGVGYTGAERGENRGWIGSSGSSNGEMDVLAVKRDGGTQFHRPTATNVTNGNYTVGGPATWVTLGDPNAEAVVDGGLNSGNPRMPNAAAALYVNNTLRAIEAFDADIADINNINSPGEFIAFNFIPTAALDLAPDLTDPTSLIAQQAPQLNIEVQGEVNSFNVLNTNANYASFNNFNGVVPTRTIGTVYSDGVANGANFVDQAGSTVIYDTFLSARNVIAGDFKFDGERNLMDIAEMIKAYNDRQGGAAWDGDGDNTAVIEILGDFDANGSFDIEDVRYFADGLLLIDNGIDLDADTVADKTLDRLAAFVEVDVQAVGNFFGTVIASGATYQNGDSVADIAGPGVVARSTGQNENVTPGFAPTGHDGNVDLIDVDYVQANFGDWTDLAVAARIDLSADMNGDLVVDAADALFIIEQVLEVPVGDLDLDGNVDVQTITDNIGTTPAVYSRGDVNFDGVINQDDVDAVSGVVCTGDANGDLVVNVDDFIAVLLNFGSAGAGELTGDANSDGLVNVQDFIAVLLNFGQSCE